MNNGVGEYAGLCFYLSSYRLGVWCDAVASFST